MKGGGMFRIRGKHFSYSLIALVIATVFLWYLEKKPLATVLSNLDTLDLSNSVARDSKDIVIPKFSAQEHRYPHTVPQVEPITDGSVASDVDSTSGIDSITETNETELTASLDNDDEKDAHQRLNEEESSSSLDSNDDKDAHRRSNQPQLNTSLNSNDGKGAHRRSNGQGLNDTLDSNSNKDARERLNELEFTPSLDSNDGKGAHKKSRAQDPTATFDSNGDKDAHQRSNDQKLIPPLDSDDGKSEQPTEIKECNYGKGRWVLDNATHPLYSGFKCKQWLSDMWSCRLTRRPNFSYEAYRWQPEDCEMPVFDGPTFLKKMQDKTIAFVGDSLGRQQFQSLMCMVTGGEHHPEVQDVGRKYGFFLSRGAARPNGWAFRFPATNTTILYHWTACLCGLEPINSSDPRSLVAMHLDRPAAFLQQFLPALDVVILNTGHHWNRGKLNANRWVMYVEGKPNTDKIRARMGNAKDFTIHSVAKWLDEQIGTHNLKVKAFFRTISPRHFANGDWNTGGSCDNTIPLANGNAVTQEESSDQVIARAVRGTRVRLLDVTALSQLRDEGHISRYRSKDSTGFQDCLHWCLPGIPDTWNEILAAQV